MTVGNGNAIPDRHLFREPGLGDVSGRVSQFERQALEWTAMLRLALFDLDDTLYSSGCGLWPVIGMRIDQYMVERVGLAPERTVAMRRHYLQTYGTTLNGLRHEYGVDAHDYLAFVHDISLERFLRPEPALSQMLGRLPLEKAVFTNADAAHAGRVLAALGIAEHFSRLIDVHTLDFISKPDPRAYERVLAITGAQPGECIFADDRVNNLRPAGELGMTTVLIGAAGAELPAGVGFQIESILDIEPIINAALAQTSQTRHAVEAGATSGA